LTPGSASRRIGIADIKPECAIGSEHSPNFTKYVDQVHNIVIDLRFCSYLPFIPIVTHSPIGRRGDATVKNAIREQGKLLSNVAMDNLYRISPGKDV